MIDFSDMFHSGSFDFLIGPDHREVTVHRCLFKTISAPLHALTGSDESKDHDNEAVLEDVGVPEFEAICEFAYTGAYKTAIRKANDAAVESYLSKYPDRKLPSSFIFPPGEALAHSNSVFGPRRAATPSPPNARPFPGSPATVLSTPGAMLLHAKAYFLGARYSIQPLQLESMKNLHAALAGLQLGHEPHKSAHVDALCAVLDLVYNEPEPDVQPLPISTQTLGLFGQPTTTYKPDATASSGGGAPFNHPVGGFGGQTAGHSLFASKCCGPSPFNNTDTSNNKSKSSLFSSAGTSGGNSGPGLFGGAGTSGGNPGPSLFGGAGTSGGNPGPGLFGGAGTSGGNSGPGLFGGPVTTDGIHRPNLFADAGTAKPDGRKWNTFRLGGERVISGPSAFGGPSPSTESAPSAPEAPKRDADSIRASEQERKRFNYEANIRSLLALFACCYGAILTKEPAFLEVLAKHPDFGRDVLLWSFHD